MPETTFADTGEYVHELGSAHPFIDGIPLLLCIWEAPLRTYRFNRHFRNLLGWTEADATSGDFMEKLFPDAAYRAKAVHEMFSAEDNWRELRLAGKSGNLVALSWMSRRLSDGSLIGIGLDSLQRRREDELLQERLIESEALKEAKREAEAANASKDRFLAILSHELRTPLTPILAASQLLEKQPGLSPTALEYLSVIKRNALLETRLIDDLLDLTRIVHGKLALAKTRMKVHEAVRQAVETCKGSARQKDVSIELMLEAPDHVIEGDQARVQQVFWNLLGNAIKFTPAGGQVTIRSRCPSDNLIEVTVADTGMGIEPGLLDRIFDAFEQGSGEVTRHFGGLGLGLAISKRLVLLHEGAIEVRSDGRAKGASFVVRFPLSTCDASTPQQSAKRSGAAPARDWHILLVEDHVDTANMMQHLLEHNGIRVTQVADVASAIARIRGEQYDLMLCDLSLPDGTGLDIMKAIGTGNIKAIAITGHGTEADMTACRDAGFLRHLTKPIDLDKLEEAITEVLDDGENFST